MGLISSRAVLLKPPEPRKSEIHPRANINPITAPDRLVCNELRKEIQRSVCNQKSEARDRISLLQVSSQSLQQEDVRSILPLEENSISRDGYNRRPTELF